jgi:hypothetical protein
MNLDQFKLSEDERSLLVEMTDFGVPLYELRNDVSLSYPRHSSAEQLEIAKRVLLSVVGKGLASLCRLTLENTKDNVYEVNESTSMAIDDIQHHISQRINWEQSSDSMRPSDSLLRRLRLGLNVKFSTGESSD